MVVAIKLPLRVTRYPVTPTLSVAALQARSIREEEDAAAVRFAGTVGADVSAVLLLTVTVTFEAACVFPAASRAVAERTCGPFGAVRVSQATV